MRTARVASFSNKPDAALHRAQRMALIARAAKDLSCRPGGRRRWLIDRAADTTYDCSQPLVEVLLGVVAAGQVRENVYPLLDHIRGEVDAAFAKREGEDCPSLVEAMRAETIEEGQANIAQDRAKFAAGRFLTVSELTQLIEETRDQVRAAHGLIAAAACERNRLLRAPRAGAAR